jgi:TonB family protein
MERVDTLDTPERLGKPFAASLTLHAAVVGALLATSLIRGGATAHWGDLDSGGGAVGIKTTASIPMIARQGQQNPLANDTESQVPKPPPEPKAVPKVKEPEPDAIPIKGRVPPKKAAKQQKVWTVTERYKHYTETKPNQLYSTAGGALTSPMMGTPGSGGVGLGKGSPFGDRFGAYASVLQQRLAEKWNTQDVDPRLHTAPPVVVNFRILKDGTIKDIRVTGSSGNIALDRSAERAVYDVGKVDPLPAGFDRNEAAVEYSFVLSR